MKYAYYPGCSLEATAKEYDGSARAVLTSLGVELVELEGWNCCGASSGHSHSRLVSLALPARVLALAKETGLDVVVPCAACFNRLCTVRHEMGSDPALRSDVEAVVGRSLTDLPEVLSPVSVVETALTHKGREWLPPHPLSGLRVACYYGCLLARPPEATRFGHPENPMRLENILRRLGAEPLPWTAKTECCGGNLSLTRGDLVRAMVTRIVADARRAGADALVTACPLCQTNLEMRQTGEAKLPSFYFTELAALAFGVSGLSGWLRKHLINPLPLLRSLSFGL